MVEKFKERTAVALQRLQAEHYNMSDARQGRSPRSFAQNMLRHAKAAMMTSVYNQLSLVWNNLGLEFRRDIPEPTLTTTIGQFMGQLDAKESLWYEMARQYSRPQQSEKRAIQASSSSRQSGQYGNNRQGGFSKPPFPFQPYYDQQFYSGYAPRYGDNYGNSSANRPSQQSQSQQGTSRQANPALPAPRQPLQITAGNASNSTSRPSTYRPNPRGGFERGRGRNRNLPSRPRQGTAYQGSESRDSDSYHASEPEGSATNDLESISDSHLDSVSDYQEPDNYFAADNEEEYDYLVPRAEDESAGYFATTKVYPSVTTFQCRDCQMTFLSRNELHRYLGNPGRGRRASKSACQANPKAGSALAATSAKAGSVLAAAPDDSDDADPEVIHSTSDSREVGTGNAFCGYHYAMGLAKVTAESILEMFCFDTGCSISLVDRAWF